MKNRFCNVAGISGAVNHSDQNESLCVYFSKTLDHYCVNLIDFMARRRSNLVFFVVRMIIPLIFIILTHFFHQTQILEANCISN